MAIHFTECAALTDLAPAKKLALMACCDSADKDTRIAMPGFDTIQQWSGLKRSQAYDVIAELVALGYLARRSGGRAGRRAEFYVFPGGGCCPMHGALPDWTPADAPSDGAAEAQQSGSGVPDPDSAPDERGQEGAPSGSGSGTGSGSGSGPDRTPSRLRTYQEPPNPPASRGAKSRCRRHPNPDQPGAGCRRCGTNPRAADRQAQLEAATAAAAEVARFERDRADLPWCEHPDCSREDRWRSPDGGRAHRCPECNPDVVVGRPSRELLELADLAEALARAG